MIKFEKVDAENNLMDDCIGWLFTFLHSILYSKRNLKIVKTVGFM